ncbi:hypothetical protein [Sphaerotilus natans]|uniref:hypothetical protein n=1 Tax=Sphaerotilus natans TaxID=34103 RepID=UPI001115A0DE|nr:hypothetical protein [Sphaerotilus natans]
MRRWIELLARESAEAAAADQAETAQPQMRPDGVHPGASAVPGDTHPPAVRADVLALVGLNDQEIGRLSERVAVLRRQGYSLADAEQIADRLLVRDRTGTDMRACVECARLIGRRCAGGEMVGPPHELRRCARFAARSG